MPAKKNFKTLNPALSFINPDSDEPQAGINTDTHNYTHTRNYAFAPAQSDAEPDTSFNSPSRQAPLEHAYTHTHSKRENKSRRLQLLIKPSIHSGISGIAHRNDTSVNDIIKTILEENLRKGDN